MLVRKAARKKPDVILLPELWNTGFDPANIDPALADEDGKKTRTLFSALAKELGVNIVAGSVANRKRGALYNTAYVFSREGEIFAEYDKTHLFSPMGESSAFSAGDAPARFTLDGANCGLMICYDIRFPELARALALPGLRCALCRFRSGRALAHRAGCMHAAIAPARSKTRRTRCSATASGQQPRQSAIRRTFRRSSPRAGKRMRAGGRRRTHRFRKRVDLSDAGAPSRRAARLGGPQAGTVSNGKPRGKKSCHEPAAVRRRMPREERFSLC